MLTAALVSLCALAATVVGSWPALLPASRFSTVLLAALFFFSELLVIHVPVHDDTHTSSFSEVPLVLGLFLLPPAALAAAAVAGTTAALVLCRGQRGVKVAFNVAEVATQCFAAVFIFRTLAEGAAVGSARCSVAAIVAVVAADLLAAVLVNCAIGLFRRRWPGFGAFEFFGGALGAVAKAALGLLAVTAVADDSAAQIVMVAVVGAATYSAFRAYASVHERHARLEALYRFASSVSGSLDLEAIALAIVGESREILRAGLARLVLVRGAERMVWRAGDVDSRRVADDGSDGYEWRTLVERGETIVTEDVLAAPLLLHSDVMGYLLVRGRLGIDGEFDAVDSRLFHAIASQAAIALENGNLVAQLEIEMHDREYQAAHDPLTGLFNRVAFSEIVTAILGQEHARRALFVVGLDRFSQVNETLGHDNGDFVLRTIFSRLNDAIVGTVGARLGGDEMALLTPPLGNDAPVEPLVETLLAVLRRPVLVEGLELEVGASIGVALAPIHTQNGVSLLRFADTAMRQAKVRRSTCETHSGEIELKARRRLVLADELRTAIEQHQLVVHYQPKVSIASYDVVGVEALVRWCHPTRGLVPPIEFIPIAENTGLIGRLTSVVIEASLHQRREWADDGLQLPVAINVSARSLADPRFADEIARALVRHRCPVDALTIEITETQLMADMGATSRTLRELHSLGVRISIDDFGTGFSSLSSLRELPLDEIKIDKSFVGGAAATERDAVIVRSTANLAESLGLHVVAEGVEDEQTVALLRSCNVETVQGFLFARPLPPPEVALWARAQAARRLRLSR